MRCSFAKRSIAFAVQACQTAGERAMPPHGPVRITSPSGLAVQVNANASIRRIDCQDVLLNAFLGNELEGGPANIVLRRHTDRIAWTPLLGPCSPGSVHLDETGLDVR